MSDDDVPDLEDCSEQLAKTRSIRGVSSDTPTPAPAPAPVAATPPVVAEKKKPAAAGGFGGLKKGFLSGGSSAPKKIVSKPAAAAALKKADDDIPIFKPTGKVEEGPGLDHLKNLKISQETIPDWMKPSEDLMQSVASDNVLMKGMTDPKFSKALDEISKDPRAWEKYQGDPEVLEYFRRMCGVFGQQFEKSEKAEAGGSKK